MNPPRHPGRRAALASVLSVLILHAASAQPEHPPILELVESYPSETTLDRPDIPDARDTWPAMIDGADVTIDWAAFYVSGYEGSSFDRILEALANASRRGIAVRVLSDRVFYDTYPDVLHELHDMPNVSVRLIDYRGLVGGVMHAKYFILDGDEAFVGSQNLDWRALDHIVEMGLRIRLPAYARALLGVFERDWDRGYEVGTLAPEIASSEETEDAATDAVTVDDIAAAEATGLIEHPSPIAFTSRDGEMVTLYPAFSPRGDIPDPAHWDLPLIVETIDGAVDSVHVTLLTYKPVTRDGAYWPTLENALRGAAVRGAVVRVLVADWGKRNPTIDFLKSLQCVPGIEVRMVTIPESPSGFIPFARVTHAKYLTVDGRRFWLGTSNWEKSYFTTSRNVGVVADHPSITKELDRSFNRLWSSPYAYLVDPATTYEPPRISD